MSGDQCYSDGFVDGQLDILDSILEIVDDWGTYEVAADEIATFVANQKKEIESL